jgi:hypothetical protein
LAEAIGDTKNWRRSTFCADGACVEVAQDGDRVLMRDSKDTSQPFLGFDRATWADFIAEIENGSLRHL